MSSRSDDLELPDHLSRQWQHEVSHITKSVASLENLGTTLSTVRSYLDQVFGDTQISYGSLRVDVSDWDGIILTVLDSVVDATVNSHRQLISITTLHVGRSDDKLGRIESYSIVELLRHGDEVR